MLTIDNLKFSYRRKATPVINDLSLSLQSGGVYGLLGRNGVGKSTLLYLIAGLLTPQEGTVTFNDTDTRLRLPSTLNDIFIVTEQFDLPSVTLMKYVKAHSPLYPRFSYDDLTRHLDTFGLTPGIHLGALSMGQRKKAYMSFALACNTSLLLLDEPTNGLDIPGKSAFRRFIAGSMTDERTVVISTHQVRDIDSMLDHVIIMEGSGVVLDASVGSIAERLRFGLNECIENADDILYSAKSPEGLLTIARNADGSDSRVNLETLFALATSRPELMAEIFTHTTAES